MKKHKKQTEKGNFIQNLLQNKVLISVLLCVIYFGSIAGFWFFYRANNNTLELLCYISQIIGGFFVVVGTVIAVLQYVFNSKSARDDADKQRKMEAAKMADEYRKNIIPLINSLSIAYTSTRFKKEIIDYLDSANLVEFNKHELERLFPEKKWMSYRVLLAQNYLLQTDENFKQLNYKYNHDNNLTNEEKNTIAKELNTALMGALVEISDRSTELSNSLEYMCICFNTNIADDETVYQSLHKSFFIAVHMIYIFAFEVNENEHDRLFYNIMTLYKKWKKINKEKMEEEMRVKVKMEEELNSVKTQYYEKITVKTKCK